MNIRDTLSKEFTILSPSDDPGSMNQALQVAFLFEQDLLRNTQCFSGPVSVQSVIDRYEVSRSVGHEAIRILQHREVIQVKRGPNGGLKVIAQSDDNLKNSVIRFLLRRGFSADQCKQAREALLHVRSSLPANNPANDLMALMLDVLNQVSDECTDNFATTVASHDKLRAQQIARQIIAGSTAVGGGEKCLRIGHEFELCEQFQVSKPVIRQAIRILEAQSLVETRRGRGRGLYFTRPQPGPVARLFALWLMGRGATFSQIFELEHPLRVVIAMLVKRGNIAESDYLRLQSLQESIERNAQVQLVDIINMEKYVCWLADNALLDLLLRSMTVYKLCRVRYQNVLQDHSCSYASLNGEFLHSLFDSNEARIEYFCQQKNHYLRNTDLDFLRAQ